jgi:hypothetical protein
MLAGALKDGYDGEGAGFAKSVADDALTFLPLGTVVGAAGKAVRLARGAKVTKGAADLKYAPRVRARGVEDPKSHNFPYSFDKDILSTKPIPKKNGYNIYQKEGTMTGKVVTDPKTGVRTQQYKEGVFEIGVNKDGVIDHRFFRPND